LWFILSNKIIPFLTTIQKSATIPIIQGKESGCQNSVSPKNTHIRESGIVTITKSACKNESYNKTSEAIKNIIQNIIEVKRLFIESFIISFIHQVINLYQVGNL
jgi:hypothetical protein